MKRYAWTKMSTCCSNLDGSVEKLARCGEYIPNKLWHTSTVLNLQLNLVVASTRVLNSVLCLCLIRPGRHPKISVFENSGGRI
jgi:hypothetical protein